MKKVRSLVNERVVGGFILGFLVEWAARVVLG